MKFGMVKFYEVESLAINPKKYFIEVRYGRLFQTASCSATTSANSRTRPNEEIQNDSTTEMEFHVPELIHDLLVCLSTPIRLPPRRCSVKDCQNFQCPYQSTNFMEGGTK